MFEKTLKDAQKYAAILSRADMVFILLPPLMLLLIVGTLAQKPMGLYAAQKMFFGSFLFWVGILPLPGGYTLIGIISLSLLAKFFFNSKWTLRKAGINITHFGILVLLFGSLITAMNARESFMVIPEGTESPYLYDYHQRTLYIFEDDVLQQMIPFEKLNLRITNIPFTLDIQNTCSNCNIVKRAGDGNFKGMAQFMALQSTAPGKDPESDIPGVTLQVSGLNDQDGTYIAFEGMPEPLRIYANNKEYKIIFGKQQRELPFSIHLNKFRREVYPGTDKARAYSSDVSIIDNGIEWPAKIEMNAPLHYKGFTFYQSSFEQSEAMQATILSVVENEGRMFPYIGTLILAIGLLLHIVTILREKNA